MADKLSDGRLGIIALADKFEVIPRNIAEKIRAINDTLFIILNAPAGNDPTRTTPTPNIRFPTILMW